MKPKYQGIPIEFNTTPAMRQKLRQLHDQQPKYFGPDHRAKQKLQDSLRAARLTEKLAQSTRRKLERQHPLTPKIFGKKTPITKRNRIPRRTPQRAAQERRYRERVKVWLGQFHFCEWEGCTNKPTECHHRNGRRGKLLLFEDYWFALCQHHHRDVHDNPAEGRRRGLLCEPGAWNDQRIAQ